MDMYLGLCMYVCIYVLYITGLHTWPLPCLFFVSERAKKYATAFCYFATLKSNAQMEPNRQTPSALTHTPTSTLMQSSLCVCVCVLFVCFSRADESSAAISWHFLAHSPYRFLSPWMAGKWKCKGERKSQLKENPLTSLGLHWRRKKGAGKLSEAKSTLKLSAHFGVKWCRATKWSSNTYTP